MESFKNRPSLSAGSVVAGSPNKGEGSYVAPRPSIDVLLWDSKRWPPTWICLLGLGPTRLTGEIGILTGIRPADLPSARRCFLYMEHEESCYLGCLLFDDIAFSRYITALLQKHCNRPIAEIGSLDVTFTL